MLQCLKHSKAAAVAHHKHASRTHSQLRVVEQAQKRVGLVMLRQALQIRCQVTAVTLLVTLPGAHAQPHPAAAATTMTRYP
jgi:hypothetical protein